MTDWSSEIGLLFANISLANIAFRMQGLEVGGWSLCTSSSQIGTWANNLL